MMISAGVIVYMVELKSEFVENVANCHWFSRCGMRDEFSFEVDYLDEAECVEQYIASSKWENVCLERRGDFTSYLSLNYREEYRKSWNVLVREVKGKVFSKCFRQGAVLIAVWMVWKVSGGKVYCILKGGAMMGRTFEDEFMDIQAGLISLCLELTQLFVNIYDHQHFQIHFVKYCDQHN